MVQKIQLNSIMSFTMIPFLLQANRIIQCDQDFTIYCSLHGRTTQIYGLAATPS